MSEPGATSKLTLRPSSGQHGTIALNLFAIYLGTARTTRLYVNFINRRNDFFDGPFSRECFLRIIFFLSEVPLRIFPLSLPLVRYLEVWICMIRKGERWKSSIIKKPMQKNVEILFFNIGNILLLYLSVSNTTIYFDILKYLSKGWCRQIILRGTSIDIALNIQWGNS